MFSAQKRKEERKKNSNKVELKYHGLMHLEGENLNRRCTPLLQNHLGNLSPGSPTKAHRDFGSCGRMGYTTSCAVTWQIVMCHIGLQKYKSCGVYSLQRLSGRFQKVSKVAGLDSLGLLKILSCEVVKVKPKFQ